MQIIIFIKNRIYIKIICFEIRMFEQKFNLQNFKYAKSLFYRKFDGSKFILYHTRF